MWKHSFRVFGAFAIGSCIYIKYKKENQYPLFSTANELHSFLANDRKEQKILDEKALLTVIEPFVDKEVEKIIHKMKEKYLCEFAYDIQDCEVQCGILKITQPRHSFTREQILCLIQKKLRNHGFKVKVFYTKWDNVPYLVIKLPN